MPVKNRAGRIRDRFVKIPAFNQKYGIESV